MKWKLAAAALLLVAGPVLAANEVEQGKSLGRAKLVPITGGVFYADTSARWFRMDVNGNLIAVAGDALVNQTSGYIPLISDTTAVGSIGDSSAVQSQYAGYIIHGFYVRASCPAAGNVGLTRIAISIRTHLFGLDDTLDTEAVGRSRAQGVSVDSLGYYGAGVVHTQVVSGDDEMIVVLNRESAVAGVAGRAGPIGRYVPLEYGPAGGLRLPNFSIRERVITASANTNLVQIYAYCTVLR
jgi:hypothetical protein